MSSTFLFLVKTDEPNKKRITTYHYMPELLTEEELKLGILVDEVPQAENIPDMRSELFYNTDTQELFYEYYVLEPQPSTPEQSIKKMQEILDALKEENNNLRKSQADQDEIIMQLTLGGM